MSDLVAFDDLGMLDGGDLRAVFGQVPTVQVVHALAGTPAGLRRRLIGKLPRSLNDDLDARLLAADVVPVESVRAAQEALVDAVRRLSRGGQIAFDLPEDMVA